MTESDILSAVDAGEAKDWEFKSAKGGLPGSMWETYSAMANTDGGVIVLGVEQRERKFTVSGLDDPAAMKANFWSTINNRGKVSANLLTDDQAEIKTVSGKAVLVVVVPRADRRQRPVYVGQNPLLGTYRRNYEGDFRCNEDEVGRMLADRSEDPADSTILEQFHLKDLDKRSVQQYRQRFSARDPDHPWLKEDMRGFLEKLGGWRRDRKTDQAGLTIAGLLMFGKDLAIHDPDAVPQFHLDYRERFSDDPEVRWTDRITIDGTWAGNLFQFYQRCIQRLTAELKIPFHMEPTLFRKDETVVHEAIREALVNALIHADFRGQGGIVIEKYRDRFEFSNPGTLLVSFDQLLKGGVSECRNKSLQTMFLMIGGGEKAGSGVDKIRQAWKSQHWRSPRIGETLRPDRVNLILPMVSFLPEESLERLRGRFRREFERLNPLEVQALVTAEIEGSVSNSRMQELCSEHPTNLTRMLQGLVNKSLLDQVGSKRGASYRLKGLPHKPGDLPHKGMDSPHTETDLPHIGEPPKGSEFGAELVAIAQEARDKLRMAPTEMERIIIRLCKGRFLTVPQIARLVERHPKGVRDRFVTPLVQAGKLKLRFPNEPNRPDQAYSSGSKGIKGHG
jgi:ATP-dependent DNA helicase RecG